VTTVHPAVGYVKLWRHWAWNDRVATDGVIYIAGGQRRARSGGPGGEGRRRGNPGSGKWKTRAVSYLLCMFKPVRSMIIHRD
jgi:hypothetical protein